MVYLMKLTANPFAQNISGIMKCWMLPQVMEVCWGSHSCGESGLVLCCR